MNSFRILFLIISIFVAFHSDQCQAAIKLNDGWEYQWDANREELLRENTDLRHQVTAAHVTNELVIFTFRIFGLQIQYQRLPNVEAKTTLLERIKQAAMVLPLQECLDAIGLSAARFHHWTKRQVRCLLID